jgi:RNA polymerase sigma-70 factor (ECF subfamily)
MSDKSSDVDSEFNELLSAWSGGDDDAQQQLIPLVYEELRKVAHRYMRWERPGHTLQTTALVHETYLRLLESRRVRWQNRSHFLAISAQLMRRILVDFARSRNALKRGAGAPRVPLDESRHQDADSTVDFEALDDVLDALSTFDARKARVVELRFFGGLGVEETAHVLDVSTDTVRRDWKLARAWLLRELSEGAPVVP